MLFTFPFHRTRLRRANRKPFAIESLERRALLTVPAFSSLPGADHTILLDFDGQDVTGTSWNSYYNQTLLQAPAYDIDGNPDVFNATELARIGDAWQRVAEDFRPFDVNVTTVDPGVESLRNSGSGDNAWGVRVIMTNEAGMVTDPAERTGAGGIAYINSFNWSSDTPVWVFTTGGKSIAEAASHEVGHSLGLSHDGTSSSSYYTGHGSGETGWASIMGVGYYQNVTQWDRGEYFGTNNGGSGANYGRGPDDLSIIVDGNGFSYRGDDHGDIDSTASSLSISGTTVSDSGIIGTTNDVDVLRFTTGTGNVTLDIDPFTPGPNLDVLARLFDSSGNLIATSQPESQLSASFDLDLAAGTYFLRIDGTGVGDPSASSPTGYSDYASLGSYSITGQVVSSAAEPVLSVADVVVNEGDGTAILTVSLSGTLAGPVTVDYATVNGTATGADYSSRSGTLVFAAAGTQILSIPVTDDSLVEPAEQFQLTLSNADGAIIGDGSASVTIEDNDTSISIGDASINEGNTGKGRKNRDNPQLRDMVFTISLANATSTSVSVSYQTADETATVEDDDYRFASGTVEFAPGETVKTITVTVVGDTVQEGDETFRVLLSSANGATIADDTGVGTILEDDTGGGRGGKGKKGARGIVADPFWYFEAPDIAGHHHEHDHELSGDHTNRSAMSHSASDLSAPVSSRRDDNWLLSLTDQVSPTLAADVAAPEVTNLEANITDASDRLEDLDDSELSSGLRDVVENETQLSEHDLEIVLAAIQLPDVAV